MPTGRSFQTNSISGVPIATNRRQWGANFRTGNLHFDGDIFIEGSHKPSFCVESAEDVTITGTVDRGAQIKAQGDVLVGGGINGHRTRVEAGGNVRTASVHQARVCTDGDTALSAGGHHAELRAGKRLLGAADDGHAGLIGGQAWAGSLIDLHSAGDESGSRMVVVAGLNPEIERHIDQIQQRTMRSRTHIAQLLEHFYLLKEHQTLRQQLGQEARDAKVHIHQTAFPGVVIRIGGGEQIIEVKIHHMRYSVEGDKLRQEPLYKD